MLFLLGFHYQATDPTSAEMTQSPEVTGRGGGHLGAGVTWAVLCSTPAWHLVIVGITQFCRRHVL